MEEILETVLSEDVVSTVALADGGHLVVWASPNGTGTGIWGQRYDAAGVEVGAIYPIYTSAAPLGTSVSTEMARLDNGDIALVFAANDADASGIYHVTLDEFGQLDGMVPEVANTFETGTQFWHSVSALSGGGYVVTWESSGQDGSGLGVFGQVFSATGVPVGSEFQANSYTTSNQHIQNVTGLADGGFLVTWYSAAGQWGSDASGGIFAQRFDATGTATGVEFHVNTSTDGTQYDPYVVDLQDGGFAVLWTSHETDNTGLFFQRYDADGATVGEETQAAGLTGFNRFDKVTSVIKLQDGGFAVLWNDISETALKVQSFDIQGNAITDIHAIATNAERVTTNNPPDLDQLADGRLVVTWVTQGDAYREILQAPPATAESSIGQGPEEILETVLSEDVVSTVALADGGHLVVWASPNGTGTGIWGQRYDAAGVEVGAIYPIYTSAAPLGTSVSTEMARLDNGDIALVFAANDADASGIYHVTLDEFGQLDGMVPEVANTFETGTQFWHSVSALSGGGYVVTWESSGQDGSGLGVFGQVFSATGVPVGSEFQANSYTTSNQHIQNVTGLADGGFLVTWYSAAGQWGSDASGGIFAQRFDATGTATGVEFHVNTSTDGTQYDPYVVDLQDGGFAVLWTSHETDNTGLFFQRYDADGATVGEETQAAGLTGFNRFDKVTSVIKLQDGGFAVLWNDISETALKVQSFDIQGNAITDIHAIATNAERVTTNNPPDLDQLADGRLVVTWVTQGDAYREILQAPPATAESSIGQGPEEILETVLSEDVVSTVALADGGHLVVWASPNGTGTGIWGQRYDAAGVEVGAIYPIYTSAAPLGTSVSTEMARLDNGDIALVFAANDADASGIYHVTLDEFGQLDGMVPEVANTFETGTQFWHSVSALSGGGYVVTWESSGQDGSGLGVFGQVFSATGVPVGSEFQANSYTTSNQHIQNVTGLADGGFLVTWYSAAGQWGSDASGGIFAQRFDATGTATGVEFHVNTSTDGTQYDPYVVDLQDGGFAVLWTSHETDNTGLFFQRYDADGATVGEETQAAGLTGFNRFDKVTSVIKLQDGGFAVLWNDISETALKVQSFDIQGNAITDIHAIATNAERVTTNNPPDLDQLADGRLVVTWVTQGDAYREILQAPPVAGFGSQGVISGTSGNDVINGPYQDAQGDGVSAADDFILAGAGDDIINSADGVDIIYGGSGNDLIDGGTGNDTLTGDAGTDTLTGGSGADVFVFKQNTGSDTITDFDVSEGDLIQIYGVSGQSEINLSQVGGDTEIRTTSGDVLAVVEGVHLTDFGNFLFG